jgi:UDP-N-acetylglucosamine/UDP-N-acetylgalactosamine diphosphorylase
MSRLPASASELHHNLDSMMLEEDIALRYEVVDQDHVLKHVADLSDSEKVSLLKQLQGIKVEDLSSMLESALSEQKTTSDDIQSFVGTVRRSTDAAQVKESRTVGLKAIRSGEVAALVLAGGQGTRLGFDGPKGKYDIGLPSGRTLFQLFAERIARLGELADDSTTTTTTAAIPFYIMTSPINHNDTVSFFKENSYFGLSSENVKLFQQGMLPCLTNEGKIIMQSSHEVAMAPDGNGGIYSSLAASGTLDDMARRGVKYIHVFSIDNALTKPADPVFVGYCISQGADCGNKVVWKAAPHEKVGVMASNKANKPCVVEYSDITTEMAERTDDNDINRLVFGAGNICNHFYTLDFLRDVVLPNFGDMYHVAQKKIPFYNEQSKETITPTTNNGIKLESFIFDVFPLSTKMAVLDVLREQEFAPVKNAPGSPTDSPDTARMLISSQAKQWVQEAGGTLTGDVESTCEVSPLTSYSGEGLEELVKGKEINCPFAL